MGNVSYMLDEFNKILIMFIMTWFNLYILCILDITSQIPKYKFKTYSSIRVFMFIVYVSCVLVPKIT